MTDDIAKVMAGSVGHFWAHNDPDSLSTSEPVTTGALRAAEDGRLELTTLVSESPGSTPNLDGTPVPEYFVGSTDNGTVLADGLSYSSNSVRGGKVSTSRYDVSSLVVGVATDDAATPKFTRVCGDWHGLARWAGVRATSEDATTDSAGRVSGFKIDVRRLDPIEIELSNRPARLSLGSSWKITGPYDSRLVSAPLTFCVTPNRPERVGFPVSILKQVQDLLSVAFQGFVGASGASARQARSDEHERHSYDLWDERLMRCPQGARPADTSRTEPLFYFGDIGELNGIDRWIDLSDQHPQIVRPLVTPYRRGRSYAELVLVDVGNAIDYWRGVNKGSRAWAREKFQPLAVSNSLGTEFADWVGNLSQWSETFWSSYNKIKHYIPDEQPDDETIYYMANSGISLLTCVVLQEISEPGTRDAVSRALGHYRWDSRGEQLRSWLSAREDESSGNP